MKKSLLLTFVIFGMSVGSIFAQTDAKLEQKCKEFVTKLNEQLTTADGKLAMTEDQKTQVFAAYLDGEKKMKTAREAATTEEEKKEVQKPIRQAMNANIRKNILTNDQRMALNAKKE
jgi:hypothetical protein